MEKRYKYPRTPHFPFSGGRTNDDKVLQSVAHFLGQEIVVTEKMDGENTTMASAYTHARSTTSGGHESRNWLKRFHGEIAHVIPESMRICGENLYAKHSIAYDDLPSYFMGFSVWDGDLCLSWDATIDYFALIGICPVPVIYRGIFDEDMLRGLPDKMDLDKHEGFVVRFADAFKYDQFQERVAKWVRSKHVQTDDHWMFSAVVPNKLRK
jgi:hypothetical protein